MRSLSKFILKLIYDVISFAYESLFLQRAQNFNTYPGCHILDSVARERKQASSLVEIFLKFFSLLTFSLPLPHPQWINCLQIQN